MRPILTETQESRDQFRIGLMVASPVVISLKCYFLMSLYDEITNIYNEFGTNKCEQLVICINL